MSPSSCVARDRDEVGGEEDGTATLAFVLISSADILLQGLAGAMGRWKRVRSASQ